MLPEELEPIAIDPHCAPGVAVDQLVEMLGQLLDTELLRETVGMIDEASYGAGIDIDGDGAVPLGPQVFPEERIKAFIFTDIHGVNSSVPQSGFRKISSPSDAAELGR